jgi:rhodanese-related sulfurtransferase
MKNSVNSEELKNLLEKDPNATVVIDVRRKGDFEADKSLIPGAQWKDPQQVDIWSEELPRGKAVVVYCVRGGSVSQSVAKELTEKQIQVSFLEGGFAAWKQTTGKP